MRNIFSRRAARDRDLHDELQSHLDQLVRDGISRGMSPDAATHAARRELGNLGAASEMTREEWRWNWLDHLMQDVRYGTRALRRSPGFTIIAIASLALGIGANTAIFSLMNAVARRSLPVQHPEQLVAISDGGSGAGVFTNPIWEQLRDQPSLFAGSLAYSAKTFNLANGGEVRMAQGELVSGSFFEVLGVHAIAGRLLQRSDDMRGCAGLVAVSAGFAERQFGSAELAVGKAITVSGQPFQVIGVTDPGFSGVEVGKPVDIYAPLCSQAITTGDPKVLDDRSGWYLSILARAREGMSLPEIRSRLAVVSPSVFLATLPGHGAAAQQGEYLKNKLGAQPAAGGISGVRQMYSTALTMLMIVVGVVLIIACANIANLLLARAASRQREMAIRLAIGAGRGRLFRQLLTESLMLSLSGALIGVLFANWSARVLVRFLSTNARPVGLDLPIDLRVLAFTAGVAIVSGVLFGLTPAWRAARTDPQVAMKAGGRGVLRGDRVQQIGKSLVVGQVALSLVLVVAAGLLVGSFRKLDTLDPGFQRKGIVLAEINFGAAGIKGPDVMVSTLEMLRRIRQLPGVSSASVSMITPISGHGWNGFVTAAGFAPATKRDGLAFFNQVSEDYFPTLHSAMRAGRDLTRDDIAERRNVAIINETMARRVFGTLSPIGRAFTADAGEDGAAPLEVVGVVQDAKYTRLDEVTPPTVFLPLGVGGATFPSAPQFEIRSARLPSEIMREVKELAGSVSPAIGLQFTTLTDLVAASLTRPRLLAVLSGFFGLLALLLAMIGLYGTIAYSVAQRRSEIGVRIALGAGTARVLRMVVGDATRIIVAGIVIGALLTFAGTRFIASFLYGMTATDPTTLAAAAIALIVTGLGAASVPAWRGAQLDPMEALREE